MVSGFVTSPELQDRICFEEASPMLIASKLLMSIKVKSLGQSGRCAVRGGRELASRLSLRLDVLSVLFLGRLVGLAAFALGLDGVLRLVGGLGRRGADTR